MTTEQRLDRIESIMLQMAQQQQINTGAIGELRLSQQANADGITQLTNAIGELRSSQSSNADAITQLTIQMEQGFAESRQQLQESASYLVGVIGDFVEELQQDRTQAKQDREIIREMQAEIREMQTEVRGLQTENQRMLEYLFGQQGEGEV